MKIRKPYTITESEKNRIRGLHTTTLQKLINEQAVCESCGKVHENKHGCGVAYEEELGEEMLTDLNGGTYEVAETNLPDGWRMMTKEDLQEERYMGDMYDVWFGNEKDDVILEQQETMYELPKRFGNKRLTESALINMINNIIN